MSDAGTDLSPEETCLLVGVEIRRDRDGPSDDSQWTASTEESLEELAELASSAGATVLGSDIQVRQTAHRATLIGQGKVEELRRWVVEVDADLVLFDRSLFPSQQRNLESALDCKVIDRTQLILEIFARHARTREGQLQVELAQLTYLLPRLTGRGAEMSRLGGGIGTRGPGETKLETDRRRIGRRINKLKANLGAVRATRRSQRKKRGSVPLSTVSLVGYTNAGKSTLFNALTSANVLADPKMFATLDPTIRAHDLPSRRRVLLSDTVGFLRHLPPTLIQAFRATLEEVTEAAMIVHVVDVSSPHWRLRRQEVDKVLNEIEAAQKPQILALNKIDEMDPEQVAAVLRSLRTSGSVAEPVAISALEGRGLSDLLRAIDLELPGDDVATERYHFAFGEGEKISFLYDHARILDRIDTPQGVEITAVAPHSVRLRLSRNAVGRDGDEAATGPRSARLEPENVA